MMTTPRRTPELLGPTSQREDPGCDDDGVDVSVGFVLVHL